MSEEPIEPKEGEKKIFSWVNKQGIMWKFKFYGFFKNLKYFEPYLLIILLSWEFNLYQIGILIAVQEIVTFIFEVPSGMLADTRGKKTELLFCFVFYIISFIFYFVGQAYIFLIFGAMFFGLGLMMLLVSFFLYHNSSAKTTIQSLNLVR